MSDSSRFARPAEGNIVVVDPQSLKLLETFTREALDDAVERERIISGLSPRVRAPARRVLAKADELAAAVGLKTSFLLQRLGCDVATPGDLKALSVKGLERCEASLATVGAAIALQDRRDDKRHVVKMFGTLLRQADELPAPVALREVLATGPDSPWRYLELGEIAAAEELAASAQRGENRIADPHNPYASLPIVHVSPPRLEAYLREDSDALGPNVLQRIRDHVEGSGRHPRPCKACRSVAADLKRVAHIA